MPRYLLLFLSTALTVMSGRAQYQDVTVVTDSVKPAVTLETITHSSIGEAAIVSAPLFLGSLVVKGVDHRFADRLAAHFPAHERHEYYLQYVPAVTLLGMKAFGLEGVSTWPQMLTADACAVAFMGGAVELLKHTSDVSRPDGSDSHSFPSGHTATAFMTATMLSHEYGARYPWVAVAGYGVATATGMMRISQNRHYLSDVMAGASIGIMATELGYLVSDLIFHKPVFADIDCADSAYRPSFVGYNVSFNVPLSSFMADHAMELKTASGCTLSAEGAWFWSRHWGVGAQASYSHARYYINGIAQTDPLEYLSGDAGLYYSLPMSSRFSLMLRALMGYGHYKSTDYECMDYDDPSLASGSDTHHPDGHCSQSIGSHGGLDWKCGASLDMHVRHNLTYSLGLTYNDLPAMSSAGSRSSRLGIDIRLSLNF